MKLSKIFILSLFVFFAAGNASAHRCKNPEEGRADPKNNTVINEISIDEKGIPTVEFEKVVLHNGERLVFVGPKEFEIFFKEGSFFHDSEKENPGYYQTTNGVIILEVSREKTEKLESGSVFKYSVFIDGVELDPMAEWENDEM